MKRPRALISGAGVAGLSLAYWLLRAGWSVTLVEAAPALRTGGYKIDVRGVATEVLRRMDLYDAARSKKLHMKTSAVLNRSGKPIATLPADTIEGRTGDDLELVRGDLLTILADSLGGEMAWKFGESVENLTETTNGVTATFSRSAAQDFELAFGADGLHSRVRTLVFGPEAQFSKPFGAYVGVFAAPELEIPEWTEWLYPFGPGKSLVVYRTRPGDPAMVMLLFRADLPASLVRRAEMEAQKQVLRETFGEGSWIMRSVLAQLAATSELYFDTVSQVHMPRWSQGRMALLGDAAHAATLASGQGTSLALVGAYVLAQRLQGTSDYPRAFKVYESTLRPFVGANQQLAEGNLEGMVPKTRASLTLQTLMLRLMPYLPGKSYIIRRITEPIQRAANALELPAL